MTPADERPPQYMTDEEIHAATGKHPSREPPPFYLPGEVRAAVDAATERAERYWREQPVVIHGDYCLKAAAIEVTSELVAVLRVAKQRLIGAKHVAVGILEENGHQHTIDQIDAALAKFQKWANGGQNE